MNFNMSTDNVVSLQIFSINVNDSSDEEDNMKKTEINAVQEADES